MFFTLVGVYWGFIGGLMISMGAFTARYRPFWCLGFTCFFMLFHLSDFKKFYDERNWLALTGRFIALYGITAFIISFFVLIFGGFTQIDIFDIVGFPIVMLASIIVVTVWMLLKQYGEHTWLYREFAKVVDGLHVIGVLWKNEESKD